jgi:hypothetical protein
MSILMQIKNCFQDYPIVHQLVKNIDNYQDARYVRENYLVAASKFYALEG